MSWMGRANDIRKEADISQQTAANKKMVRYHRSKHPVSTNNIDNAVLVKNSNSHSRKRKRVLDEPNGYEGKVIERNKNRYRITIESETGIISTSW